MNKSVGAILLNILGVFASIILSILFVLMSFILPVYYSVAGMLEPKTITTVIQNIDYVEIIKESAEVNKAMEDVGIDSEIADEIIKSNAVGGLLKDCADKLTSVLGDSSEDLSQLDAAFLQGLVDKHIDGILTVVEEKMETSIGKSEIKSGINQFIEENSEAIGQTFTELKPVKEAIVTYDTITKTVQYSLKWYYALGLAFVEILFLGLIYLMRKQNFGGFIWIAVDTGIVGVLVSAVVAVVSSGLIKEVIVDLPIFATGIIGSAIGAAVTKLTIALVVCFVIMVGSIVACVLLRARKKKMAAMLIEEPVTSLIEETV